MMKHCLIFTVFLMCTATYAQASELNFHFKSPSFGGNPNNATYLQYEASANNQHTEDNALSTQSTITDLVTRSVSFRIATNITDAMFGAGHIDSGTSLLGDGSSVSWNRAGSLVTVTFTGVDGATTTFIVPDP